MAAGDLVQASDLSSLYSTLFAIVAHPSFDYHNGTFNINSNNGYNNTTAVTGSTWPLAGALIDDNKYDNLYTLAEMLDIYYGNQFNNPFTQVNAGDQICWADYGADAQTVIDAVKQQYESPWAYSANWDMTLSQKLTASVSNWNGKYRATFSIDFARMLDLKNFFSGGGEIRISLDHSTTSTDLQAVSWTTLCSDFGTYTISVRPTDNVNTALVTRNHIADVSQSTAGTPTPVTVKKIFSSDTYYSSNFINVKAVVDDNGATLASSIEITVDIEDNHVADTGSWNNDGGGTWTGTDTVAGTTSLSIDVLEPNNTTGSVQFALPTYTRNQDFTSY